ncbi:hypothetical protein BDQ17DRAFT_1370013 [Cyathus striatus]|nr:hypothetical protein BDQ17DRAFT_1370013 [Cyathus striatus]
MSPESDSKKQITRAPHPFDGSEGSDIVLRTSDKVDFHVHRVILSMASPFFKTMFTLPQPQASDAASKSVIDVPEHSNALDPLLRLCHPVEDPVITDITLLGDVLDAALKYDFTKAVNILKSRLREFAQYSPLHVYAISCQLCLEEIATSAAQRWRAIAPTADEGTVANGKLVDWGNTAVGSSYIEEMAKISAGSFYRLTQFVRTGIATSFCECKTEPVSDPTSRTFPKTPAVSSSGTLPIDPSPLSRYYFSNASSTSSSGTASSITSPLPRFSLSNASSSGAAPTATSSLSRLSFSKTPNTETPMPAKSTPLFSFSVPLSRASSSSETFSKTSASPIPFEFSPSTTTSYTPSFFSLFNSAFNFTDSDLTILTSDGLTFRVHELILRLCAPTMLWGVKADNEGKKVLTIAENGRTLSILLQICYPSMTVDSGLTMPEISLALITAVKFGMKKAIDKLKSMLTFSTPTDALNIYFTFARNINISEATEVARSDILLFSPLSSLYVPEMEQISARYYYHLLQYRHACLSVLFAAGSKYYQDDYSDKETDQQWWTTMKKISSSSICLAGPIVEKHIRRSQQGPAAVNLHSASKTSVDRFNMKQLHDESIKLKKEIEETISKEDRVLKLNLASYRYAFMPKWILRREQKPLVIRYEPRSV